MRWFAFTVCAIVGVGFLGLYEVASSPGCWRGQCYSSCYVPAPPCYILVQGGDGGRQQQQQVDNNSRRVHIVLIFDDNDATLRDAVRREGSMLKTLLDGLPSQDVAEVHLISGAQVTRDRFLGRIRNLPVGQNEALLVYYNGHGANKEGATLEEHVLRLTRNDERLERRDLLAAMAEKNNRLRVLLTDSCFEEIAPVETLEIGGAPKTVRPVRDEGRVVPILHELLVNHKGTVDINACQLKQKAFTDVFTPAFVNLCNDLKWTEEVAAATTWASFFDDLTKATEKAFQEELAKTNTQEMKDQAEGKGPKGPDGQPTPVPKGQTPRAFGDLAQVKRVDRPLGVWEGDISQPPADEGAGEATPEAPAPAPGAAGLAPARLTVHVPRDARVFLDGQPTKQTSELRLFDTPPLAPERTYFYNVRAEMARGGRVLVETRRVAVEAGRSTDVNFGSLSAALPEPKEAEGTPARVTVRLPADAKLWVEDMACKLTGPVRTFDTAPVPPGQPYHYTLKAEMVRDGKVLTASRRVEFEAGTEVDVDLRDLAAAAALGQRARITVHLPADAKLYVDDVLCKETSDARTFETPELDAGRTYSYTLKAEVVRDGKTRSASRRVEFQAGGAVAVDWRDLAGAAVAQR